MKSTHGLNLILSILLSVTGISPLAHADGGDERGPGHFPPPQHGPGDRGDQGNRGDQHRDDGHGPQAPLAQLIPVYRFFGGARHFQTLNYNEGVNAGMRYEGISFNVLAAPLAGTAPLYRCNVAGTVDHFISADAACEGQRTEGLYGYVFQAANRQAAQPIYRCEGRGDHLSTLNANECNAAGYRIESVQGFTAQ